MHPERPAKCPRCKRYSPKDSRYPAWIGAYPWMFVVVCECDRQWTPIKPPPKPSDGQLDLFDDLSE